MAGGPAVGQLRRSVQRGEHERTPSIEYVHCACCGARFAGHRDDGSVWHRSPAHPWIARAFLLVRVWADTSLRRDHCPAVLLERAMGIYNTRLAIVLPLIGLYMPFAVFWMRAHFVNMPAEISEAALVDGATSWDLFWRIHVPLARAPIASLGILLSVWTWNQFLLALVLVEDPTQRTMAGALGAFQGHYATNIPLLCAGTMLILIPTLVIFILFQRQIIAALLQGSVKG